MQYNEAAPETPGAAEKNPKIHQKALL